MIINNPVIDQPVGIDEPVIVKPVIVEPVIDEQRAINIERMTSATLLLPTIDWHVLTLFAVPPCQELSYDKPKVPPPMNACVRKDISMDDLLFTSRDLHMSGDPNTRYLSSDEYEQLIIDSEDINLLSGFKNYLRVVHQWKEELLQQAGEEDNHEERLSPYIPENLPLS